MSGEPREGGARAPRPAGEPAAWLSAFRATWAEHARQRGRREGGWSWARLAVGVAFAAACVVLWHFPLAMLAIAAGMIALFGFKVVRHLGAAALLREALAVLRVIDEATTRAGGGIVLVRAGRRPAEANGPDERLAPVLEDGPTWPLTEQEREDLGLYAPPVGIFGLLNRTSTAAGARRLSQMLENPGLEAARIAERQAAVRWLAEHPESRLRMMAALVVLRGYDEPLGSLLAAIRAMRPLPNLSRLRALRIWSVVAGITMLVGMMMAFIGSPGWLWPLLAPAAANWVIQRRFKGRLEPRLAPWSGTAGAADALEIALESVGRHLAEGGAEAGLGVLRAHFEAAVAPPALPALRGALAWADVTGMLRHLLDWLALYQVHMAVMLAGRVIPQREQLVGGLRALADLEALMSLACFAYESPMGGAACYPTVVAGPGQLTLIAGRHPLVPPERVIANDARLSANTRLIIVTGSNMSGKSTYLRMVGVNCLLAQLGTIALAEGLTLTPVRIITDMTVRDDLAAGESYFLAEVRHVLRMLQPGALPGAGAGVVPGAGIVPGAVLGLIDEPFRGTTSPERIASARAVLEHVLRLGHLVVVATHEHTLAEVAERDAAAQNWHLRENLEVGGLVFDYHLHPGVAQTRNAVRLLEREGYPAEVVARAKEILKDGAG